MFFRIFSDIIFFLRFLKKILCFLMNSDIFLLKMKIVYDILSKLVL